MPGQDRVLSVVAADLETEIFMRSGRANALPIAFATEDSFVFSHYRSPIRKAVGRLRAGDRLLLQTEGLRVFAALRAQPARDPLADPIPVNGRDSVLGLLAPLQQWALQVIGRRFDLRVVARDGQGFVVVALAPRP